MLSLRLGVWNKRRILRNQALQIAYWLRIRDSQSFSLALRLSTYPILSVRREKNKGIWNNSPLPSPSPSPFTAFSFSPLWQDLSLLGDTLQRIMSPFLLSSSLHPFRVHSLENQTNRRSPSPETYSVLGIIWWCFVELTVISTDSFLNFWYTLVHVNFGLSGCHIMRFVL